MFRSTLVASSRAGEVFSSTPSTSPSRPTLGLEVYELYLNLLSMDGLIVYECMMELLIALNLFLLLYCSKYNNAEAEY